uniref:Uncharacterized protein n=1 Tax=Opuntia streptacantha TaxID=393608 RepID=A0A7C9ALD4_OPUST
MSDHPELFYLASSSFGRPRFVWHFDGGFCTRPCLPVHWLESRSETSGRVIGTCSNLMVHDSLMFNTPFAYGSRSRLRPIQASNRVNGMQDQVLNHSTFIVWLYFDMSRVYVLAPFQLSIVLIQVVNWLYKILGYLLYGCNFCFEWFVAQHDCVLGPCHTALEQHLPVLGLARRGPGSIYLHRIFAVVSHHGIAGPCIIALGKHRKMLETTHNGLGQRSVCVFLRHYFLFGSAYGFSSSETDYLALWQGYVVPSASLPPYLNK